MTPLTPTDISALIARGLLTPAGPTAPARKTYGPYARPTRIYIPRKKLKPDWRKHFDWRPHRRSKALARVRREHGQPI